MKKIIILIGVIFLTSGCVLGKDRLDGANIYTTIYPVTYLTESLYGEFSEINSIYPSDSNVSDYELTNKQIKEYSEADLFIYNGLSHEKNTAKDFVNENSDILLIDAMHSLSIDSSIEELWLSPNNYLMLAKNIRDNLKEYVENQYIIEHIDENYDVLAEELSFMDADLRIIAKTAVNNNKNSIVTTSNAFMFLENYGFNVISLDEDEDLATDEIEIIKNNLEDDKYLGLIINKDIDREDLIDLTVNDNIDKISVDVLYSANTELDYFNVMNEFIFNIKTLVNK